MADSVSQKPYAIRPLGYIPYSGVQMPDLRLTEQEATKISHYLSTLKRVEIERRSTLKKRLNNPEDWEGDIEKGKRSFVRLPCLNCHTITGGKRRLIGPDLSDIGTRLQAEFLYLWIENPQAFEPLTIMPNFGLKDKQLFLITRYLMSLKRKLPPVPDETPTGRLPFGPMRVAKAERLFRDLCIRCHTLDGRGGKTGPDLSYEGDKVKRRWLFQFLKNPYRIRPLGYAQNPIARMPKLRLNDDELMNMTEFISTLRKGRNLNLPLGKGRMMSERMSEAKKPGMSRTGMINIGKMVINMKGCTGCHRIGKLSLQRVTISPDLTTVGDRLKEGWMYSWIKDPQKYRPDTLMPNLGLSDMQARSVAAYLSERKQARK
ncbi:MAG: c-type cytochrome [Nitrospira sp.]|nr:c-type cytochrome [Candidatus Manganitrophaceae bacterium]HIL35493.1 c-type cytochrome [Candidatus Manganitrophaceae bacterium]